MRFSQVAFSVSLVAAVSASPISRDYYQRRAAPSSVQLKNGMDAQALNQKFQTLSASSPCAAGEEACVHGQLAQCVNGNFVMTPCASTLQCFAVPLVNKLGTSTTCDTVQDAVQRITNTGALGGLTGNKKREIVVRQNSATAPAACEAKAQKRSESTRGINNALLKRIAQNNLTDIAQSWQNLCIASGGPRDPTNDPCVQLAGIGGLNALLAGADACAQQNISDAMIDFAKGPQINNKDALIANAIAYRRNPRNALNVDGIVPSTPFCGTAPRNPELNGISNAQLEGVDPGFFGGPNFAVVPFGASGTCPFGQKPDVTTCTCN